MMIRSILATGLLTTGLIVGCSSGSSPLEPDPTGNEGLDSAGEGLSAAGGDRPPIGWLDHVGADYIGGWSCDQDTPNVSNKVHLYFDGPAPGSSTLMVGIGPANLGNEQAVTDACGGGAAHRFHWTVTSAAKAALGSGDHTVYAYGINTLAGGANALLSGSPGMMHLDAQSFLTVSGSQLVYKGAPIRLKGTNMEAIAGSTANIWQSYGNNSSTIFWLFDRLNDMGGNTVRLIFPDGAISQNADGSVPPLELDKLDNALAQLEARGMRAIVTVFNRHNWNGAYFSYGTANRAADAAKVASFVQRFKNDARVALWDVANEPTMTIDTEGTVQWAAAMRTAFKSNGAVQPITIGADIHFALTFPASNGDTLMSLSDVVSLHCYGRYKEGCTPVSADGVNYRDEGFCAASLQYLRDRTSKPILLEEFGWTERAVPGQPVWPPPHPWCLYDFPETDASMDEMYQQALSAVDQKGAVGAIQWQLQDAPEFGLITAGGQYKRPGVPGSAFERFVQWGGPSVRKFW